MTEQPGTDLVFTRASLQDRVRWATEIANAGDLVPRGFRDGNRANPAKVLLAAETGSMLGIHPIAALQGIHVIEGKPTVSAGLMSALVRRAGHKLRVTTKGSVKDKTFEATAVLIRVDDPEFQYSSTWNWERAERAGLTGKDVWKKYFEAMAKSRAISEVVKEGAEDVLMGNAYTPEEFDVPVTETGEVIEDAVVVDAPQQPQQDEERPVWGDRWEPAPWEDAIANALAFNGVGVVAKLRALYRDATQRGVLQQRMSNGTTLAETLTSLGKRAEQDVAAEQQPAEDEVI